MPSPAAPVTRALREPQGRWIAGVSTGLSQHLGWPLPLIRMGFLVLAIANGLGVLLYLALWAVLPLRREEEPETREADLLRMLGFGAVLIALAALAYAWGWGTFRASVAPLLVVGLGVALLWKQGADTGGRRRGYQWVAAVVGILLVALGGALVLAGQVGWQQAARAASVLLLILGGCALLVSPWLVRLYRDLVAERRALIREQERTDIAGKVHDSVLQTLALVQRNADDPAEVRRLARIEERRLRSWLYSPVRHEHETVEAALRAAAARVEDEYGATVDLVVVGDAALVGGLPSLVQAGSEAMVNAAKHAGDGGPISVYCEVGGERVELFVRDRGGGFDLASVPSDRHGISESIVGRLERVGGESRMASTDGGTEWRLVVAPT